MARKGHRKDNAPIGDANDPNGMQNLINEHVMHLKVRNYAADTVSQREKYGVRQDRYLGGHSMGRRSKS